MNSALEQIYKTLTPKEQATPERVPYYVMRLRFLLNVSFRPDGIMPNTMGMQESLVIPQEMTYRTTQITRFIPDHRTISEYVDKLKAAFNENPDRQARLLSLTFDGYDYLYAIAPREEKNGVPTKEALRGLIEYAFLNKIIRIIPDPSGDGVHEPVMAIGDRWLYFDSEDKDIRSMTPMVYSTRHDSDYVIRNTTDAIWDLYRTDPEGKEIGYIFAYLYEAVECPISTTETCQSITTAEEKHGMEVNRT